MIIDMEAIESRVLDLIAKDVVSILALPDDAMPVDATPYMETIWQIAQSIRKQMRNHDDY